MFCSSSIRITKEHVVPQWTYDHCTKRFFITKINGLSQTYNRTTIPACSVCNNERLSALEIYISGLFSLVDPDIKPFSFSEISNIIRWLEIIDFKFQILNSKRVFLASKEKGYIPYLANFPLSVLRDNVDYSPSKAVTEIRRSQKRLTTKSKNKNINSLIVYKTSNKGFHFIHTMDEFIFIELPKFQLALFYFYKRTFRTIKAGHKAADKILDEVYN